MSPEADRRDKRHTAERLQRVDDRCPAPRRRELAELFREPFDAAFGFVDRVAVLLQRDVLRGQRETEIGEPARSWCWPFMDAKIHHNGRTGRKDRCENTGHAV